MSQLIALLFSTTTLSDLNPSLSNPSGRGWREGCSTCSFVPEESTLTFSKGSIRSISVNRANINQRLRTNRRGVPGLFFKSLCGWIGPMPALDGLRGKLVQGGLMGANVSVAVRSPLNRSYQWGRCLSSCASYSAGGPVRALSRWPDYSPLFRLFWPCRLVLSALPSHSWRETESI